MKNEARPDAADAMIVRARLDNWSRWQRMIESPMPGEYPRIAASFGKSQSGYSVEDADAPENTPWADFDDALYIEFCICKLSEHDRNALTKYYIHCSQDFSLAAKKSRMSRRQFERWVMDAIARLVLMTELFAEDKKFNSRPQNYVLGAVK